MNEELRIAKKWLTEGSRVILAVVAKTWGSAPRQTGSLMVVHEHGHFSGSVSGGCVEGAVIAEAQALSSTLADSTASYCKTLNYKVGPDEAWQVGLACGGEIRIILFSLRADNIAAIEESLHKTGTAREKCTLRLIKQSGDAVCLSNVAESAVTETDTHIDLTLSPKQRLYITGAVHIAETLAPLAGQCGFDVTVIDPRGMFTENHGYGGVTVVCDWPDEYFSANPLDSECALVTLTHDPKIDDAALIMALESNVFYIGSLGSKKTQATRISRLKAQEIPDTSLARIHGPVGLNIGAKSPQEIAVSIMAEIIAVKRGTDAK
ncbi:XdhC family protein [Kordiimonas pumila]|uniref:XdhC family protein n=1 Tax=Kordiimonas pumila TaxID=2161677 RepID=A0ABV7D2I9_9PROT|nr:XdhC family protein [Kordiimonas pumila]